MGLPPRQPRPSLAAGLPRNSVSDDPPSAGEPIQRMVDAARSIPLPHISEPGLWAYAPLIGPAWETAYDLQEGDFAGAALNGAFLVAGLTPAGPAGSMLNLLRRVNKMRRGPLLARAGTQTARIRKIEQVGKGFEVHHTIPMKGADRSAEGLWRNHPANLKILDQATHRRLTGKWTDKVTGEVLQPFGPMGRIWHGTNALQKSGAAATVGIGADTGENLLRRPNGGRRR